MLPWLHYLPGRSLGLTRTNRERWTTTFRAQNECCLKLYSDVFDANSLLKFIGTLGVQLRCRW